MSTPHSKHNFVNYDNGSTENNITAENEIELINPQTIDGDDASCEECFYKGIILFHKILSHGRCKFVQLPCEACSI